MQWAREEGGQLELELLRSGGMRIWSAGCAVLCMGDHLVQMRARRGVYLLAVFGIWSNTVSSKGERKRLPSRGLLNCSTSVAISSNKATGEAR